MSAPHPHPLFELPTITPGPLDLLLLLVLAVAMPIWAHRGFRLFVALAARVSGRELERVRLREYRSILVALVALAIGVLLVWRIAGRSLGQLGLQAPGTELGSLELVGWLLALAGIGATGLTLWLVAVRGRRVSVGPGELGEIAFLIPETRTERRTWWGISLAAGVAEELAYRGFGMALVIALLERALPDANLPVWVSALVAALVTSLLFGIAHTYQGASRILTTGAVGLYMASLYLFTGSLWAPMLAHFLLDVFQGLTLSHAFHPAPGQSSAGVLEEAS